MPSGKAGDTDAFVADASVGIAWSVVSQATPAATKLRDHIAAGTIFVVPILWPFEVANALLALLRRKRIAPADFAFVWDEIARLAEKFSLTIYDAAYLELAIRRGFALASRDTSLNDAARLCGVRTLL